MRNGRVLMHRDPDGNTADTKGIDLESHDLAITNARLLSDDARRTCEKNGFELLLRPLANDRLDFTDHLQVVESYYEHCAAIVEEVTGARAFAFDHNVRSAGGKENETRIKGGQAVQGPAHLVHGDYTLRGGPERLTQLAQPPSGNDTLLGVLEAGESLISKDDARRALADGGRFAIINVWRNIAPEPVATHPVALCDGQTVMPEGLVLWDGRGTQYSLPLSRVALRFGGKMCRAARGTFQQHV